MYNVDIVGMSGNLEVHVTSVYWTVATMTSLGYGDVHAHNPGEMMFSILIMILGKMTFGFILASVASTLSHSESEKMDYEDTITSIKVKFDF